MKGRKMATKKKTVIRTALEAILYANTTYECWSKGWWFTDSGVEGLLVAKIAEALADIQNESESLVMELPFHCIQEWSGVGRPKGRPVKTLSGRNRADIVLLDNKDRPVYVIEAKRFWQPKKCYEDLERLRDLLRKFSENQEGSLKSGFLTTTLPKKATRRQSASDRIHKEMEKIEEGICDEFDRKAQKVLCHFGPIREYPQEYRTMYDEPEWALVGLCVEVSSA